jgi:hypothetical protein
VDGAPEADVQGDVIEHSPHDRTAALQRDVEQELAAFAARLTHLAEDLERDRDVHPAEAERLAERAAEMATSARFLRIVAG